MGTAGVRPRGGQVLPAFDCVRSAIGNQQIAQPDSPSPKQRRPHLSGVRLVAHGRRVIAELAVLAAVTGCLNSTSAPR